MRQRMRLLNSTAATILLGILSPAAAHGHDSHDSNSHAILTHGGEANLSAASAASTSPVTAVVEPQSYFQYTPHAGLMFAHIILMIIAWVVVLPLCVTLSISRSRFTFPAQLAFLAVNAFGLIFGTIYNTSTPDFYPNNSHHKLGWALTWIVSAQVTLGLISLYAAHAKGIFAKYTSQDAYFPVSMERMAEHQWAELLRTPQPHRLSYDSGQGTERTSLQSPTSDSTQEAGNSNSVGGDGEDDYEDQDKAEKRGFLRDSAVDRFLWRKLQGKLSSRAVRLLDLLYETVNRTILQLGFVALATGLVTYAGIFKGNNVFSGLAHFIKGGIFFWYGLLTLGRWMGCYADVGWAWNVKPPKDLVGPRKAAMPSAEFVESFLYFLYGSTNVFLEHLAAWGDAWTAQDLEHVSISIMLFGGGLCGMLVESKGIRSLLNTTTYAPAFSAPSHKPQELESAWEPPKTYKLSMNPVPGIVTLLLGMIMSSHHQASGTSTMVHKQWGNLLVGCALARGVTYVIFYLSPPTSLLPSRPPSELVAAFCLISGGLIFMASNKDTVSAMETYQVGPMFVFTVTMGLTALLMAWVIVVMAVKGWALRREQHQVPGARPVAA